MHKSSYQSLSIDETNVLLKKYYSNLDTKVYGKEPSKIFLFVF